LKEFIEKLDNFAEDELFNVERAKVTGSLTVTFGRLLKKFIEKLDNILIPISNN
jgi:hypothetical protein